MKYPSLFRIISLLLKSVGFSLFNITFSMGNIFSALVGWIRTSKTPKLFPGGYIVIFRKSLSWLRSILFLDMANLKKSAISRTFRGQSYIDPGTFEQLDELGAYVFISQELEAIKRI